MTAGPRETNDGSRARDGVAWARFRSDARVFRFGFLLLAPLAALFVRYLPTWFSRFLLPAVCCIPIFRSYSRLFSFVCPRCGSHFFYTGDWRDLGVTVRLLTSNTCCTCGLRAGETTGA
ncbi:MAG TPA: hypothetical protein VH062_37440 [Polyangiaceae bacterium]|nr:hypothetical protein [Polyangiaceae bacterium]